MKSCTGTFLRVTILLMAVKLLMHVASGTMYELHRDELLYVSMAAHPAPGYLTVPPLTPWLAMITQGLLGFSVFGIRLLPALMGTASVWVLSLVVCRMGGGWKAMLVAGLSFVLAPGFLLFNSLCTPNATEQLLWLLIAWQFIRLSTESDPRHWMWIGTLSGLALLNKYSAAIYIACIAVALLAGRQRQLFFTRQFLYAIALGLLIISPNIRWQYQHQWPVLWHMEALQSSQLSSRQYGQFFSELFSLLFLTLLPASAGLAYLFFSGKITGLRWLAISFLCISLFFLFGQGKGYYLLGAIPVLYAAGGVALEQWLANGKQGLIQLASVILVSISLCAVPYGLPVISHDRLHAYTAATRGWIPYPFAQWEDGKRHAVSQVYADMTGWKELAGLAGEAYRRLSQAERKTVTLYCQRNYGYAGALYFYGRADSLPAPLTFLESFLLWAPDTIPPGPVIYIHREIDGMRSLFRDIEEVGMVRDPWSRENGTKVFLCRNPVPGMPAAYAAEARAAKARFTRH